MDKLIAKQQLEKICEKLESNLCDFSVKFPGAKSDSNYIYKQTECNDWTEGFWTGELFLSYEFTKNIDFANCANTCLKQLEKRFEDKIFIDHHDMGFLYSLSAVAKYKLDNDVEARNLAIKVADHLITRYNKDGKYIQAWGQIGDLTNCRLIIDSLLNLPLLYWASNEKGEEKYKNIAVKHLRTAIKNIIRDDFSTYHTYFFNPKTGEPECGRTAQGFSDESCWSRGQAWAMYGIALSYAYTKDDSLIEVFNGLTEYFISHLPNDKVPYWDFIFENGSDEPRDTSAAATAICGILEMNKYIKNEKFYNAAMDMLDAISDNYSLLDNDKSNALIFGGMGARPYGDEESATIYGDYYYMEALYRIYDENWKMYW